jgi:glyoxylase-like metal-dependent hydrolase (beta-lactamase superfamily II)
MKEIAPGIHVESAFPPYNLVLIQTQESVVVVDIPPKPVDAMNWYEQILGLVDHIDFVVLTDASLERQIAAMLWDIPIIASETLYSALAVYDDERARRDLVQRFQEMYPEAEKFVDQLKPRRPMLAFTHRLQLHYRIPPLQFETVDGAAPGSLWVTLSDLGLLIAGDTVCIDDIPPFSNIADSSAWLATLAALSRRQSVKNIVTGRGTPLVQRGEIERQREFLRVMRRAARKMARGSPQAGNLTETAQDLGQVFFNNRGQRAVKQIRQGLENLILEIKKAQVVITEAEPSS